MKNSQEFSMKQRSNNFLKNFIGLVVAKLPLPTKKQTHKHTNVYDTKYIYIFKKNYTIDQFNRDKTCTI